MNLEEQRDLDRVTKLNRRPRILNVDDDELLGQLLTLVYGDAYDLYHATSLHEARQFLVSSRFDLLLLDLSFPDGDGFELLRELQAGRLRKPRAILMLSGASARTTMEESYGLGALAYINKPVDLPLLSQAIHIALTVPQQRRGGQGEKPRWA